VTDVALYKPWLGVGVSSVKSGGVVGVVASQDAGVVDEAGGDEWHITHHMFSRVM